LESQNQERGLPTRSFHVSVGRGRERGGKTRGRTSSNCAFSLSTVGEKGKGGKGDGKRQ